MCRIPTEDHVPPPTIGEASRLLDALLRAGTIRRLDLLHCALVEAHRTGLADAQREQAAVQ